MRSFQIVVILVLLVLPLSGKGGITICLQNLTPASTMQEGYPKVGPIKFYLRYYVGSENYAKTPTESVPSGVFNGASKCISYPRSVGPLGQVVVILPTNEVLINKIQDTALFQYECCSYKWYNPYNKNLYCYPKGRYPLPAPYNLPCARP